MSQVGGELDVQRKRVWVAQKKWKGEGLCAEISGMDKDMGEIHYVTSGILFACGVAEGISMGSEMVESSFGGTEVERGAVACDKKDMDQHSDIRPGLLIEFGPVLESVRESPES